MLCFPPQQEEPDGDDALATGMSEPKSFGKQQPAHADFWSDGGTDDADTDDPVSRPESTTMREAKKTKSLPLLMLEDPASAPPDDEYDPGVPTQKQLFYYIPF